MSEEQKTIRFFAIVELTFAIIDAVLGIFTLINGDSQTAMSAFLRAVILFVVWYMLMKVVKDPHDYQGARMVVIIDLVFEVMGIVLGIATKDYTTAFSNLISGGISFFLLTTINKVKQD